MRTTKIIKISLITFLILFTTIYIIENYIETKNIEISKIDNSYLNKHIKLKAEIKKQSLYKNNLFLTLKQENQTIKAVIFKTNKTLNKSQNYTIEGKITKYKNELEIIINKIY